MCVLVQVGTPPFGPPPQCFLSWRFRQNVGIRLAKGAKLHGTLRQIVSLNEIQGYGTFAKSVAKHKHAGAVGRQTAKNAPRRATRGLLLLIATARPAL
jgi:hypothetical protein